MNPREVYETAIRQLAPQDRLRVATIILEEITGANVTESIDEQDAWSEEDMTDLAAYGLRSFSVGSEEASV